MEGGPHAKSLFVGGLILITTLNYKTHKIDLLFNRKKNQGRRTTVLSRQSISLKPASLVLF